MKRLTISFLLIMSLTLSSCKSEEVGYDSFDHIDHWDQINDLDDGIVILYFYSPTCLVCQAIEEDVFYYANIARKNHKIYFIQAGMILDQGVPDFVIPSTPSLIILENKVLLYYQYGPINVVDYFKELAK